MIFPGRDQSVRCFLPIHIRPGITLPNLRSDLISGTSPAAPTAKSLSPDSTCDKAARLSIEWQCCEMDRVKTTKATQLEIRQILFMVTFCPAWCLYSICPD